MQSQGVTRYMKCLDMLEAKYDKRIPRDEYEKRKTSYEAFDAQAKELNRRYMSSISSFGTVHEGEGDGDNLDDEDDFDDEDEGEDEFEDDGFVVNDDEEDIDNNPPAAEAKQSEAKRSKEK